MFANMETVLHYIKHFEEEKRFIDQIDPMKLNQWEQKRRRRAENLLILLYVKKHNLRNLP